MTTTPGAPDRRPHRIRAAAGRRGWRGGRPTAGRPPGPGRAAGRRVRRPRSPVEAHDRRGFEADRLPVSSSSSTCTSPAASTVRPAQTAAGHPRSGCGPTRCRSSDRCSNCRACRDGQLGQLEAVGQSGPPVDAVPRSGCGRCGGEAAAAADHGRPALSCSASPARWTAWALPPVFVVVIAVAIRRGRCSRPARPCPADMGGPFRRASPLVVSLLRPGGLVQGTELTKRIRSARRSLQNLCIGSARGCGQVAGPVRSPRWAPGRAGGGGVVR